MVSLTQRDLPDLANLRDTGGLRTRDGRRTRAGVLLRSATPYFLDAAQARLLTREHGLRLRIDLRSRGEVAGATNAHLSAIEHDVLLAPLRSGGPGALPDLGDPGSSMAAHYLRFLEHAGDSFVALARALADPTRVPALVHCTFGKDRTGAAVAVVLSAVGVLDEEIVADYARTRGQTDVLLERLLELPEYAARLAELPAESLQAVPATMAGFLAGLAERGGGREYIRSLGLEEGVLDDLTTNLVRGRRRDRRERTGLRLDAPPGVRLVILRRPERLNTPQRHARERAAVGA